jgi:CheY-like chemotaxis protein
MLKSKILVVEDECITAMEIRQILESSGYQPYTARSCEEAVK